MVVRDHRGDPAVDPELKEHRLAAQGAARVDGVELGHHDDVRRTATAAPAAAAATAAAAALHAGQTCARRDEREDGDLGGGVERVGMYIASILAPMYHHTTKKSPLNTLETKTLHPTPYRHYCLIKNTININRRPLTPKSMSHYCNI